MRKTLPHTILHFKKKLLPTLFLALVTNHFIYAKTYYINDSSTQGDIFTKNAGNDAHDGLSPESPKLTFSSVYQVAVSGDIIYVDIGKYDPKDMAIFNTNSTKKVQIIMANSNQEVFEKTPLPTEQKITAEVFYIVNDKPVSREEYLKHLLHLASKK